MSVAGSDAERSMTLRMPEAAIETFCFHVQHELQPNFAVEVAYVPDMVLRVRPLGPCLAPPIARANVTMLWPARPGRAPAVEVLLTTVA